MVADVAAVTVIHSLMFGLENKIIKLGYIWKLLLFQPRKQPFFIFFSKLEQEKNIQKKLTFEKRCLNKK